MSESQLGGGDQIYAALEAGYGVVPDGPLEGVSLHVPRSNPNWKLPEGTYHLTASFSDEQEIQELIAKSLTEARRTGGLDVPQEVLEVFYERAKQPNPTPEEGGETDEIRAAFETHYVIKGLGFSFPYQLQRVIEFNTARAIVGSYHDPKIPRRYRSTLRQNLGGPMQLWELYYFYENIEQRFEEREDRSTVGTAALADEIERLVSQVMNQRWAVFALPPGSGEQLDTVGQITAPKTEVNDTLSAELPTQQEVTDAFERLTNSIGSEMILRWGLGPNLSELSRFVIGLMPSTGEQTPYEDLLASLLERYKAAPKGTPERAEIRSFIQQLHQLGHLSSLYNNRTN